MIENDITVYNKQKGKEQDHPLTHRLLAPSLTGLLARLLARLFAHLLTNARPRIGAHNAMAAIVADWWLLKTSNEKICNS